MKQIIFKIFFLIIAAYIVFSGLNNIKNPSSGFDPRLGLIAFAVLVAMVIDDIRIFIKNRLKGK